ncbi:hypothetical protein QNA08_00300 [Chelatococcus sp. SYSU_G07232]|uniref:Uncharacterized protein n=1 Tax=Chelatococcus albus TaxID=3047466 RepID=A0ABT7ABE0_9HYPH|nr:hypothetical protein [Chelatococcus sp. SYSU_G07232]MDJ1156690.1 hypothetical protein [Chelatococcus sp. SYSU_G07232]
MREEIVHLRRARAKLVEERRTLAARMASDEHVASNFAEAFQQIQQTIERLDRAIEDEKDIGSTTHRNSD